MITCAKEVLILLYMLISRDGGRVREIVAVIARIYFVYVRGIRERHREGREEGMKLRGERMKRKEREGNSLPDALRMRRLNSTAP